MDHMALRASRLLQTLIAITVMAGIIFVEIISYGPDIDGRTPSWADMGQLIAIELAIILSFALSAIALFRSHKLGWWSSFVLDGLLSLIVISMIADDFRDRYVVTEEGANAFRDDLAIHGAVLLMCVGAVGFLLIARKQLTMNKPS